MERRGHVEVTVYDAAGNRVADLLKKDLVPGVHDLGWDGKGANGTDVARGAYTYRVTIDGNDVEERPLWIP